MLNLKRIIKRGIQYAASNFGRHTRPGNTPELLVLMYHRVLPLNDPRTCSEEPGMIVTPATFRQHVILLKKHFQLIQLSEWVNIKHSAVPSNKPYCAITFDDGWADNYEFAFPVLKELQVPATIFLVADMIGTQQVFWPERLTGLLATIAEHYPDSWNNSELAWVKSLASELPDVNNVTSLATDRENLAKIIARAKRFTDPDVHQQIDKVESQLGINNHHQQSALLNWQQLQEMVDSKLIEAGSHTCQHIRLDSNTPLDVAEKEIRQSKSIIEDKTGEPVTSFCFPNGDYTQQTLLLVKQLYQCAVTTNYGWNTQQDDPFILNRIGVHQDISADKTAFLARLSGWM